MNLYNINYNNIIYSTVQKRARVTEVCNSPDERQGERNERSDDSTPLPPSPRTPSDHELDVEDGPEISECSNLTPENLSMKDSRTDDSIKKEDDEILIINTKFIIAEGLIPGLNTLQSVRKLLEVRVLRPLVDISPLSMF